MIPLDMIPGHSRSDLSMPLFWVLKPSIEYLKSLNILTSGALLPSLELFHGYNLPNQGLRAKSFGNVHGFQGSPTPGLDVIGFIVNCGSIGVDHNLWALVVRKSRIWGPIR